MFKLALTCAVPQMRNQNKLHQVVTGIVPATLKKFCCQELKIIPKYTYACKYILPH